MTIKLPNMLKILFLLLLGCTATASRAQSIIDLTEELALDVEKLASIKSTLQDMVAGYEQLKAGYTQIRDVVRDNFQLHKIFLDALWITHPAVRDDPRLTAILATSTRLVARIRSAQAQWGSGPVFTAAEISYISGMLTHLLDRCGSDLDELALVTTDHALQMSDAQRLQALDRIGAELNSMTAFLQQLSTSLAVEAARRQREANDITTLKKLYGLPD